MCHFRCFVDCGTIVSSSNKFRVTSECLNAVIDGATYTWRLERLRPDNQVWEIFANLDNITATPINVSNIIIKPNTLLSYSQYRLQLNVKAPMLETEGLALLEFETAGKPYGGHCKSSVTEGVELETEITFECLGWQDKSTPITYEIRRGKNLIYYSASTKSDPIALSAGLPEENYQVQIAIIVKNAVGEAVVEIVILKVDASNYLCSCMFHLRIFQFVLLNGTLQCNLLQITPSSKLDPCHSALEEVEDNLNNLVLDMDGFLSKGEIIQAAQLATLVLKSARESKNTECGQSLPSDVQNNVSSKANIGESYDCHFFFIQIIYTTWRWVITIKQGWYHVENLTPQRHDRVHVCILAFSLDFIVSLSR